MTVKILGVEIDDLEEGEALLFVERRVKAGERTFIATPNPEMLVLAQKDEEFKRILNEADLRLADGYGLQKGAKILGNRLGSHITGTDFMMRLCKWAGEAGLSAYLLGAGPGVAKKTAENLKKVFPALAIAGAEHGGTMDDWDSRVIIKHINALRPDILFVALGHGKQEKWIARNFGKLESVRIAIGIGGAFDFLSGHARRAPLWMRKRGLEWLWRLAREPRRVKRIANAVVVFPWLCLMERRKRPVKPSL